jgi:hypothetical protein
MTETFKTIIEFPKYDVSDFGNVRNKKTGRILKGGCNKKGYLVVGLRNNEGKKTIKIHRLVAVTFLDNPKNKKCIDHINNNRSDNNLINLRFATQMQNSQNSKLSSKNTSGCKGVCKVKNKWRATIQINGIKIHLGYFETIEEAKIARVTRANEAFGIYTNAIEKMILI